MKKVLLCIFVLLSVVQIAKADGINIADTGIQPGNSITVQVALTSTGETYRAVGFLLSLPNGITIAKDEYDTPVTIADKKITDAGYTVSANHLSGGNYRFAVINTNDARVIPSECGPLFTFTIEADASLVPGTVLTATLSEILLTDAYQTDHNIDDITFSISLEESRIILDETSTSAPEAATGADVRVRRTINANEWSTICLPFDMTEAQVKSAFGNDVQLADFNGCDATLDTDENTVGLTVKFTDATAIEANHPYIIKVSSNITTFTVDNVDIAPSDNLVVEKDEYEYTYQIGKKTYTGYMYNNFVGTYVANTIVPDLSMFLSGNKFWYSSGNTKMKAFRAYFEFYDVLTSVEGASSRINLSFVDNPTGIKSMPTKSQDGSFYDLQGRQVSKPMKKGIYINNGKKVVK